MDVLYRRCLAASAALHVGLLVLGNARFRFDIRLPHPERVIDLTLPLGNRDRPPPGPLGRPGLPAPPPVATPVEAAVPVLPPAPLAPFLPPPPAVVPSADPRPAPPGPEAPSEPAPAPATVPAAPGNPSGSAAGDPAATGGGGPGGPGTRTLRPDVLPVLLNKEEVLANLRRYYPEAERKAGREAKVVVKLRLGVSGKVEAVDVLQSGGAAFDAAARQVAERMRFSPAMKDGAPIPVALPQVILFKLE